MQILKDLEDLRSSYPEKEFLVFRIVGGLGSQLFSLSEAYILHKHTGKKIVLDYSSCEFLDNNGEAHSVQFSKGYVWAVSIKINKLTELLSSRHMIDGFFPERHSYINEGFIPSFDRVVSAGLYIPGFFPLKLEFEEIDDVPAAIHYRYSPLYKGNLGNINEFYLKEIFNTVLIPSGIKNLRVFSNNQIHALETMKRLETKRNINFEFSSIDDPIKEIFLMSRAKLLICSNSAMSWWASYFGMNQSYFPKPFYLGFWDWDKNLFGYNMKQINQFKFMPIQRIKFLLLKFFNARGLYKIKIVSTFLRIIRISD